MKFIEELQQRPNDEKGAFAALAAGLVALVLFLLWGMVFFNTSGKSITKTIDSTQTASVVNGLQDVQTSVSDTVSKFSSQYSELRKTLKSNGEDAFTQGNVIITTDKNGKVQINNTQQGPVQISQDNSAEQK